MKTIEEVREWIDEELSYEKIDPEPKARIDVLKEMKSLIERR